MNRPFCPPSLDGSSSTAGPLSDDSPLLVALQQAAAAAQQSDPADAAALDLLRRVLGAADAAAGRRRAAELLAEYTKADLVVVGRYQDGLCQIEAVAGTASVPPSMVSDIEAALSESTAVARVIRTSTQKPHSDASLAHRPLADALIQHNPTAGQHCTLTLPLLTDSDAAVGAVQVSWFGRAAIEPAQENFLRRVQPCLAEACAVLDQNIEHAWIKRLRDWRALASRRRAQIAGVGLGLMVAVGFLPIAYPVRADVTLQPQQRRIVAAPFDAPLGTISVAPGDAVTAGQLLCSLDTEEARTRLTALQAESQRIESERAGHLAGRRLGDAEIARLDGQRNQAELQQLQQYLQQADIRSPIDGVVLGEDLQPHSGVPLETGQVLLEIAPLDVLVARLEIPPDQIMHVRAGQNVVLRLDAAGRIDGTTLQRVAPRGEANEQGGYRFTAQATVDNAEGILKPGMQGTARIDTDRKPLAWCLLQRLWQRIKNWS